MSVRIYLCRYFRNNSNVWLPKLPMLNDSDYGRHMITALIQQVLTVLIFRHVRIIREIMLEHSQAQGLYSIRECIFITLKYEYLV